MRRKRVQIAVGLIALGGCALFFGAKKLLTWYMFENGEAHGKSDSSYFLNKPVDLSCGSLTNTTKTDLVLHLEFDLPLVDFEGVLKIEDSSISDEEGFHRRIFIGPFRNEITIRELCFSPTPGHESSKLVFYFMDDSHYYAFSMLEELPIFKYGEIDVLFTRFHAHVYGNFAILSPTEL